MAKKSTLRAVRAQARVNRAADGDVTPQRKTVVAPREELPARPRKVVLNAAAVRPTVHAGTREYALREGDAVVYHDRSEVQSNPLAGLVGLVIGATNNGTSSFGVVRTQIMFTVAWPNGAIMIHGPGYLRKLVADADD